jgi:hypothetical protein
MIARQAQLAQHELEPQFVHLMHDDEVQLVGHERHRRHPGRSAVREVDRA